MPGSRSKNGESIVVPLVPRMLDDNVLRPGIRTGAYVFSSGRIGDKPINGWTLFAPRIAALMKEELGTIEPWHIHDLRRTAATAWGNHGVDEHVIAMLLNHSTDSGITATYNRSDRIDERRRVLEWWSDRLATLKTPPAGDNIVKLRAAE